MPADKFLEGTPKPRHNARKYYILKKKKTHFPSRFSPFFPPFPVFLRPLFSFSPELALPLPLVELPPLLSCLVLLDLLLLDLVFGGEGSSLSSSFLPEEEESFFSVLWIDGQLGRTVCFIHVLFFHTIGTPLPIINPQKHTPAPATTKRVHLTIPFPDSPRINKQRTAHTSASFPSYKQHTPYSSYTPNDAPYKSSCASRNAGLRISSTCSYRDIRRLGRGGRDLGSGTSVSWVDD
jgi:hypothetical protein